MGISQKFRCGSSLRAKSLVEAEPNKSKDNMQFISPLQFIEIWNNGHEFVGMLDSGAQLNVISENLLPFLKIKKIPCQISQVQGFSGGASEIQEWVEIPFTLTNGRMAAVTFAVLPNIGTQLILGLPFLKEVKGVLDHYNKIIETPEGPIQILEGRRVNPKVHMIEKTEGKLDNEFDPKTATMGRLTTDERAKVQALLEQYGSVWKRQRRGKAYGVSHAIILDTKRPIKCKPRAFCKEHQDVIQREITEMLSKGVIAPSSSPYASEVVMVKKPNGNWRFCVDYRLINEHTVTDKYPIPRIQDLLHGIQNATYIVALDLRSGYWQILMDPDSTSATAFRCPMGLFEFLVMPFGLKNAPATFQRTMDFLFGDMYNHGVSIYIDDILIFGTNFKTVMDLLEEVLRRLAAAGFTLNIEKSRFFEPQIEYLGHLVGDGSLRPNPKRVEVLRQLRPAVNVKEVRGLLGMFGFYRIYIPNFADIMRPLTNILKARGKSSTTRVDWTLEMETALRIAGRILGDAVLTIPIESDDFLLETDASDTAIAGILSVTRHGKWVPVEFMSKKLSDVQRKWPIREKEAYAIIHSLHKFDGFLRVRRFKVHTDHQSLKWLLQAQTGKLARWASRLAEYNMEILWKRGSDLVHVDCFSRQVEHDEDIQPRMIYNITTPDPSSLPSMQNIIKAQGTQIPLGRGYVKKDDIIFYRNGIWVPESVRSQVIAACHSLPPYCHPGTKRTARNICKVFNWPGLHADVTLYVRSCLICQRSRPGLERLQGAIKTHPIPGAFQTVYLDFWHCTYNGTKYIVLTMVDQATKWVEAVVIPNQKSDTVAAAFLQTWVCRFGVPFTLITDNEQPLISEVLKRLAAQLGVKKIRTTPYHPQGNAPIEAFHKTLNRRVIYFEGLQDSEGMPFETALQLILWGYRAVIHSTMGESPAFLVYGIDPRPPFDNDWRMIDRVPEQDRVRYLNLLREDIQSRAFRRLEYLNDEKRRLKNLIEVGDLVLIRRQPHELIQAGIRDSTATKLLPHWGLPSRVIHSSKGAHRLLVRDLMSGKEREVHITDIRAVSPPQTDQQRQEWNVQVEAELKRSVLEPGERQRRLTRFWEHIDQPQRKQVCRRSFDGDNDRVRTPK